MASNLNIKNKKIKIIEPFIKIIEQPKMHVLFQCETSPIIEDEIIQGASSTLDHPTFPSVQIVGYEGNVSVLVSCVIKDPKNGKYFSHPHQVVNKNNSYETVFSCVFMKIKDSTIISFPNLIIKKCKKVNFKEALENREKMEIDPYQVGFTHKNNPNKIDLNSLRLCFQVYLTDDFITKYSKALEPVVSNVIFNRSQSPVIYNFSPTIGSSLGGTQVTLSGDNIIKNDEIVFFELNQKGERIWEAAATYKPLDLIKKYSITFLTPPYDKVIYQPIKVYVELRKSDGEASEPWPFTIYPESIDGSIPLKRAFDIKFGEIMNAVQSTDKSSIPSTSYCTDTVLLQNHKFLLRNMITAKYKRPYQNETYPQMNQPPMIHQKYHLYGQLPYSHMSMNNSNGASRIIPPSFYNNLSSYPGQATSTITSGSDQPSSTSNDYTMMPQASMPEASMPQASMCLNNAVTAITSPECDPSSPFQDEDYNMLTPKPLYIDETTESSLSGNVNDTSSITSDSSAPIDDEKHKSTVLKSLLQAKPISTSNLSPNNLDGTSTGHQPGNLVNDMHNMVDLKASFDPQSSNDNLKQFQQ